MLRATSLLRVAALARPFAVRTFAAGAKAVVKAGPKATDLASVLADEISYEKDEGSASDSQLASIAQSLHSSSGFKVEGKSRSPENSCGRQPNPWTVTEIIARC
jgi:hypothetical protein